MLNRSIKDALVAEEKFFRSRPVCSCRSLLYCSVRIPLANCILNLLFLK